MAAIAASSSAATVCDDADNLRAVVAVLGGGVGRPATDEVGRDAEEAVVAADADPADEGGAAAPSDVRGGVKCATDAART